jgi:hypothetical protein
MDQPMLESKFRLFPAILLLAWVDGGNWPKRLACAVTELTLRVPKFFTKKIRFGGKKMYGKKGLDLPEMARKLLGKFCIFFATPLPDTCAKKNPLVSMWA